MAPRDTVTPGPTVHQALYGYEDGHRLLVSSTDLANPDQRLLVRQTDSPDAGRNGWTELLAGFPLPSGRFAWCLTWPAPEMPRPGCVWTHVLIFDPETVGEVGLFSPRRTFRRPEGPRPELTPYRKPLSVARDQSSRVDSSGKLRDVLGTATWAFFEPPTRPVRIGQVTLDEESRHLLLMSLWEEGWPALRRVMSLADAPHAIRELPDRPFDLQLQSSARRVPGAEERLIDGLLEREPPRWARALAAEALEPDGLVRFLAAYGPELPAQRDCVAPLARLWLAWEDSDPGQLLAILQNSLPDSAEGGAIKLALLDPAKRPVGCSAAISEQALLAVLVKEDDLPGIDLRDLRISERVTDLLNSAPEALEVILEAMPSNSTPAGSLVLDALSAAEDKAVLEWFRADPAGLPKLLRLRPALAARRAVSRSLSAGELWEAIRRSRGVRKRVNVAVEIIDAGGELDPQQVSSGWQGSAMPIVQRLTETGADSKTLGPWVDVLDPGDRLALAREENQPPALIAALAERSAAEDLKKWKTDVLASVLEEDPGPAVSARVFLSALEQQQRPSWAILAVKSYTYLYPYAVAKKLGTARVLVAEVAADALPERDVGGRLAKTLNRALKQGRWAEQAALECEDRAAFQALIDADNRAALARRVLTRVVDDPTLAADWQVASLTAAATERADPAWVAKHFAKAVLAGVGRAFRL